VPVDVGDDVGELGAARVAVRHVADQADLVPAAVPVLVRLRRRRTDPAGHQQPADRQHRERRGGDAPVHDVLLTPAVVPADAHSPTARRGARVSARLPTAEATAYSGGD
jgi:hypothetical protein